ncbi:MAG: DNA primase [Chitinophagaceae bacterium]|jgi:DNA primase|nr:DNA primase [Chitinophagaceae bacterium]
MIAKDTIEKIINRLDIVEVVGDFVKLRKRGSNYIGLCPFHNEKSPSFSVSPSKELFKCFGCGKSGNSITFLMEHEKISYTEALRWLGKKYHVEIEETQTDPEYREQQQAADSLSIINQFARDFFARQLLEVEQGRAIGYSYLEQRGFTDETIKTFQLGYCPDSRDAFVQEALQRQYNKAYLLRSGLVAERNGQLADNYRDRIIFPIHNPTGKVIGFGARLIKKNDHAPKYINTPENELYVKSKVLYGLYFSRQSIGKLDECLLVEGYTDVISLHQAGVKNVVASGGTALTPDQLRLIKKYTNNLTIVYDGDNAGIKAALRGMDLALEEGLQIQLVLIPDGEDPDSYVRKMGEEAFRAFVQANKKDLILFQLEVGLKDAGNDSRKKNEVVQRIAETISRINKAENFSLQQDYIRKASQQLQIDEGGLVTLVNQIISERLQREDRRKRNEQPLSPTDTGEPLPPEESIEAQEKQENLLNLVISNELQERAVIKCLLQYGLWTMEDGTKVADFIFNQVAEYPFANVVLDKIFTTYQQWYLAGMEPTEKTFIYYPDKEMSTMVISMLEFPYEVSPGWDKMLESKKLKPEATGKTDVKRSVQFYKLRKLKEMLAENQKDIQTATDSLSLKAALELHMQLKGFEMEITKELGTVIMH